MAELRNAANDLLRKLIETDRKSLTLGEHNMAVARDVLFDWLATDKPETSERKTELRNLIIRSGAVSEQMAGHPEEPEISDWIRLVQAELWEAYDREVQR